MTAKITEKAIKGIFLTILFLVLILQSFMADARSIKMSEAPHKGFDTALASIHPEPPLTLGK